MPPFSTPDWFTTPHSLFDAKSARNTGNTQTRSCNYIVFAVVIFSIVVVFFAVAEHLVVVAFLLHSIQ